MTEIELLENGFGRFPKGSSSYFHSVYSVSFFIYSIDSVVFKKTLISNISETLVNGLIENMLHYVNPHHIDIMKRDY